MKTILLSLILSLCAAASYAQTTVTTSKVSSSATAAPVPAKGSNTMIITLPDSGAVAWKKTANTLMQLGYAIKSSEPELLTISTEPKAATNRAIMVALFANVQGNQVTFTGNYAIPDLQPGFSQMEVRGMRGGAFMSAWAEMDKVAAALGGTVTYARR